MPKKKETTPKKETVKETPKETPKVESSGASASQPIVSASKLDLRFDKVYLRDVNDMYVGITEETFSLDGNDYDGKNYFLVMFGNGQMYAIQKAFFTKIAQVMTQ